MDRRPDLFALAHDWAIECYRKGGGRPCDIDRARGAFQSAHAALIAENAALKADAERYRWLTEDHADPTTREKCRELLYRMPVMSYAAASHAVDLAIQEGRE